MKLWMIVMVSLGHLPYSNRRVKLRNNNKNFGNNYKKRIRFLKGRTTTSPKENLALCLLRHPAKEDDSKSNQYYDVVSTLNVLRSNGYEIPPDVELMVDHWAKIPLPPGSYDVVPEDERQKRDISARVITGMNKNLQILLVELIRLHYKRPLTAQTKGDVFQLLAKDLEKSDLGRDAIKTQLELVLGTYEAGT